MNENHLRTAAQQLRDRARQVRGVIESTHQKLELNVQSHLREAERRKDSHPDEATYWEDKAKQERVDTQKTLDSMEQDAERYESEAADFDAKADKAHDEAEKKAAQIKNAAILAALASDPEQPPK